MYFVKMAYSALTYKLKKQLENVLGTSIEHIKVWMKEIFCVEM